MLNGSFGHEVAPHTIGISKNSLTQILFDDY